MKPCKECKQQYGEFLCKELGHCVFEGTQEWPKAASNLTELLTSLEQKMIQA